MSTLHTTVQWDSGLWTWYFQTCAWASTLHCKLGLKIAGAKSHSHANVSIVHNTDLLTWVSDLSCIHIAKWWGLDLTESQQDLGSDLLPLRSLDPCPECLLILIRLIYMWMEGELGLKPESEPGLSVQCRYTLCDVNRCRCVSVAAVATILMMVQVLHCEFTECY